MVDAEDRRLVEDLVERGVERLRGGQVAAEGLFHHHPRAAGAAAGVERADHGREQARRDRQVVQRVFGAAQRLAQALEGAGVVVVAVDVAQLRRELFERGGVDATVVLEARSEEHTSELQSLMSISYAVLCLKKIK